MDPIRHTYYNVMKIILPLGAKPSELTGFHTGVETDAFVLTEERLAVCILYNIQSIKITKFWRVIYVADHNTVWYWCELDVLVMMIKPAEQVHKPGDLWHFRLQKLPVYLMNILLWIPPHCALKNKMLLKVILGFHILFLMFWVVINIIFFCAVFESNFIKIVPPMHFVAYSTNNLLVLCHEWLFLFKSLNQKKQLQLVDKLEKTACTVPKTYTVLLVMLLLFACGEIALISFVDSQLWFGDYVYEIFRFMQTDSVIKAYAILSILSRVYEITVYFLFTPYFAYLCLLVQTKLQQCHKIISCEYKLDMKEFTPLVCEALEQLGVVNSLYETNTGLFVGASSILTMTWLYMAIVFRECFSNLLFAESFCFVFALGSFLCVTGTVHTKVRNISWRQKYILWILFQIVFWFGCRFLK